MRNAVTSQLASPGSRQREWVVARVHPDRERLSREASVSPLVAQLLLNRGIATASDAQRFLVPEFRALLPPESLPNAIEAGRRLAEAARERRRIVIYGDYDVDGITATTILWHALRLCGASVSYYVPSRFDEGYGLNAAAVQKLAADGAQLIVSVDCGITAVEPARAARESGVELIITDHHQPDGALPDTALIVHPTALGERCPNADLSGAGVALKVAWALAQQLANASRVAPEFREYLQDATAFAALGLVADVVPLNGENRIITSFGLRQLCHTRNPGLRALIEVSGLANKAACDEYDVGFALAPRLNAIGRMGHAGEAVELFTEADSARAGQIARALDAHNRERQSVERRILAQAEAMVLERGMNRDGCRGIVLASQDWHAGVVGIVAARLVDRFHRPTVLVALDGELGQGSGRSIRHFPLHEALGACREHLVGFGGHAMAAGVKLLPKQVEAFTSAFQSEAARRLTAADLVPKLHLDDEARLADLSADAIETIERMAPFGAGNARPRLASGTLELVDEPRTMGTNGAHLTFTVREGEIVRRAVAFRRGGERDAIADHRRLRLAFEPMLNRWNGGRKIELRVVDWQPA